MVKAFASIEFLMLDCHVSTITQKRQSKYWLKRRTLGSLAATIVEVKRRCVQLGAVCNNL